VAEFISVKSWKAKGKRLSNYNIENVKELVPVVKDEHDKQEPDNEEDNGENDGYDDIPFEIKRPKKNEDDKNQMSLF